MISSLLLNFSSEIKLSSLIQSTPPSWKISRINGSGVTKFINQGGTTSEINYRSSVSRERYIQFYYNPDNITSISIPNALISELPVSKFSALTSFSFPNNDLRNFPDLTDIVGSSLRTLNLSRNPFHESDNSNERIVNEAIINKIPSQVTSLTLGGTFGGDIPKDILGRFTNLTNLDLTYTGGGRQFTAATNPGVCTCPNVSNTVATYSIVSNGFTSFDSSPGTDDDGNQLVSCLLYTSPSPRDS